ncbi:growth-regulating factor 3-like [Phragmites australis]|uniref:growth-regulating factor 3-like n=1 Tax=Phragmites australis TaxID=29695 RepID=UPI002D76C9D6|nr:growth-regulating factor 3-like [Phragmites australis]
MAMPSASLSPAADHRPSSLLPFCRSYPLSAVGEDAQQQQHTMSGGWAAAARPAPFTAAQYEELEQQALIYKYLVAGVPVPLDLLLPIRRGFVYHQPALGYGPYFGKKVDPEPGRCRRTDGKKWRCSKEAAPDSKYCERHMHRGRNRSRKPVEAQLVAPPHSLQPPALANPAGGFQNHSLYPAIASNCGGGGGGGGGTATGTFSLGSTAQLHLNNPVPYATAGGGGSKDLRPSAFGMRYNHFSGAMDTPMDNSWRQLPSQTSTFEVSSYPLYGTLGGLDENTICSLPKTERELLSFFGNDFVTVNSAKQENQTLRPFFDEWPKSSELADDSSLSSFSATQLSISIPMATSDFNTNSRSSNGTQSR